MATYTAQQLSDLSAYATQLQATAAAGAAIAGPLNTTPNGSAADMAYTQAAGGDLITALQALAAGGGGPDMAVSAIQGAMGQLQSGASYLAAAGAASIPAVPAPPASIAGLLSGSSGSTMKYVGIGGGAVVGWFVGGPIGAVVGAFLGSKLG